VFQLSRVPHHFTWTPSQNLTCTHTNIKKSEESLEMATHEREEGSNGN